MSYDPEPGKKDNSPYVKCSKHGTCRMSCRSSCNTGRLLDPPPVTTTLNTKDRKAYRRNQAALIKHLGRAQRAIAEMDAIMHTQEPKMLHSNVRDLRELLGNAYSMALSTRLEAWLTKGKVKIPERVRGQTSNSAFVL